MPSFRPFSNRRICLSFATLKTLALQVGLGTSFLLKGILGFFFFLLGVSPGAFAQVEISANDIPDMIKILTDARDQNKAAGASSSGTSEGKKDSTDNSGASTNKETRKVPLSQEECRSILVDHVVKSSQGRFTPCEADFFLRNLTSSPSILVTAAQVHAHIIRLCQIPMELSWAEIEGDEISDALRHFLLSVQLVQNVGYELAKEFLDIHELPRSAKDDMSSHSMDRINNQVGLEFALELKKAGVTLSRPEILLRGVDLWKKGKFTILKKSPYACQQFEALPFPDLIKAIQAAEPQGELSPSTLP